MKYARFEYNGVIYEGSVERDVISPIEDSPFQKLTPLKEKIGLNSVKLIAPVKPSKIIAVGLNYKQSSNTSKMIFNCETLIEFISNVMTLEPGDIIATGTPSGIGSMILGDEIEVRIERIGSLTNKVVKDDAR